MRQNTFLTLKEAAAGCAFALLLTLPVFLGTALGVVVFDLPEGYLMPVLMAGTMLSAFIGAMVSCPYTQIPGYFHGALVGLFYGLFLLIIGAVTVVGFTVYGGLLLRLSAALGAGILGGMTGRLRPGRG